MSAGMKSARSTPLLGLAFLISAITAAWPAAILARSAPSKSRVSTRLSASTRTASSELFFLRRRDFLALDGDDLVEDVGHGFRPPSALPWRRSVASSLALAAPDSSAARARSMPAAIESATLAA